MAQSETGSGPLDSSREGPLAHERLHDPRPTLTARLNTWMTPAVLLIGGLSLAFIVIHLWPDLDADRWQAWANANPGFFAPLTPGSVVAIVPDLHSHSGLLVSRTADGVTVERRLWFPFGETPVGLVVDPAAAEGWLQIRFDDPGFWPQWRILARDPGIRVYEHLHAESARADGYREFLRRLRGVAE